ncbi:pitrilysin family protein [Planctomycetota bacterium]|nr:pitrilysin family protein [Planctomycetota bacterium]
MKTAIKLKKRTSKILGESRFEGTLDCGMKVLIAPRPGFDKKVAFVVARYGSIDSKWKVHGKNVGVPDGIAHFLEHMMFKKERGDLTDEFAERGAYVNAHTSHTQTAYYFECVENFEENLATLLELAAVPYFEQSLVDTEREIITQEINQYRDHPGWVGYQRLLEAMYAKHPLRIDIAGTAKTVADVTPENLYQCHGTFYHPRNLTLVISGDLDASSVAEFANETIAELLETPATEGFEHATYREPKTPKVKHTQKRMFVSRPKLLMGFKDTALPTGAEKVRTDMLSTLALDALFSRESEQVDRWYNDGLVAGDFGAGFQMADTTGYAVIGGETPEPKTLETAILSVIKKARRTGVDPAAIERKRRKFYGATVRQFNSPESTAYSYIGAMQHGADVFDYPDLIDSLTPEAVNQRLKDLLKPNNAAVSTILPMKA